jgi:CheY-like chemotaxis protein
MPGFKWQPTRVTKDLSDHHEFRHREVGGYSAKVTPSALADLGRQETLKEGLMNRATVAQGRTSAGTRQLRTPERILIVEDTEAVRELISLILTEAGYECQAVGSGCEALGLLEAGERFDLMLCDLLNNPHGITLLERTKKSYPRMPVLISTAPCCLCTARFAVKSMGASGILLKPFPAKALLTTVWRTLAGRSISGSTFGTA